MMRMDSVLEGDSLSILPNLPEKTFDLIFLDPPYNLQLRQELCRPDQSNVDGLFAAWDHFENFAAYDHFTSTYLRACRRLLKPTGALWIIGSYHNIYRVGRALQDLGFWILNDVIWVKSNPMPNFRGTRFTNAHETLLWCAPSKEAAYTFHYKRLKRLNGDLQMRSDWRIPICSGKERIKDSSGKKAHPTQKPEALLRRILLGTTNVGDLVLDPFAGSGTTLSVAKSLRRNFIGIEREAAYVDVIRTRLQNTQIYPMSYLLETRDQKPPRLPFGSLVEMGLIRPGATLSTPQYPEVQARVRLDGYLQWRNTTGSIHQLGARLSRTTSCNGWKFWYYENKPIDTLRQEALSAI